MAETPRLKKKYLEIIKPELQKELGIKNVMAIPTVTKIVINSGLGEGKDDKTIIEDMVRDMTQLAAQKPVVVKSTKAISNFKLVVGKPIGVKVTLRANMMWYFLDRLISIVLPRIKDFRGIPAKAFDRRGNYAIGISEHTVFPEVDATKVTKLRGLQVIICTNAGSDENAFLLLTKLGMPFQKKK
jgi:large subunit ribosomal protein L5